MTTGVQVELRLSGSWTDITDRVYQRDAIQIKRGRSDESSRLDPGSLSMTLNNRDGRFSPRNPNGPYFGVLGRNTPVRVSVQGHYRFHGEISSWPQRWDPSGSDVYVPVEAAGILRRLGQGRGALKSAIYRELTSPNATNSPIAYWPCEDDQYAEVIASALDSGQPMSITGNPRLSADSSFVASASLPTLGSGVLKSRVPQYSITGETQVRFLIAIPDNGADADTTLVSLDATGSIKRWDLEYTGFDGALQLIGYDMDDNAAIVGSNTAFSLNGEPARVSLEWTQNGSDIDFGIVTLKPTEINGDVLSDSASGHTVGRITRVSVNPDQNLDQVAIGHISVHDQISSIFDLDSLYGYSGESAIQRMQRLCDEENIPLQTIGVADAPPKLGPQFPVTLVDLFTDAAESDTGMPYEPRDEFGIGLRNHRTLYNQDPVVTLDYTASQVAPPLEPIDDDQDVRNDVTVQRDGGSSARVVRTRGPLSVQPPPDGVGRYDERVTVSADHGGHLPHMAGWRLRLGTVDEARYPQISVNLTSSGVDTDLAEDLLLLDSGDRLEITNPPAWLPPEQISQIVQGYSEEITEFQHVITFNCSPASPWDVAEYDQTGATASRYGTSGSLLLTSATDSDTTLTVVPGTILESFEDATLAVDISEPSTSSGPWTRTQDWSMHGTWSLRSADIGDGETSDAVLTLPPEVALLRFSYKVSSEPATDGLIFYTDGTAQFSDSGENTNTVLWDVSGVSQVRFRYFKNGSTSTGDDAAWIDHLVLGVPGDWTTTDLPLDIMVGGERMTVTAVTAPSGGSQTFTVTRAVNGISKSHDAGTAVELYAPAHRAL